MDPDGVYRTQLNRTLGSTPAFCKHSLRANIRSASDLNSPPPLQKIKFFVPAVLLGLLPVILFFDFRS